MALDESRYAQPRDRRTPSNPFAAGATVGVGGGVAPATSAPRAGATVGVGGGVAQGGAATAPPPPSSPAGGGGGGGGSNSVLAQMAASGLTPEQWVALANAPKQAAAASGPMGSVDPTLTSASALDISIPELPQMPAQTGSGLYEDPALLALLAGYDSQLANTEADYRRQQADADRSYADALPGFNRNWDQNRVGIRNQFEARGLLKSGGTEDAVGRTYTQQGDDLSRMQTSLADRKANLEQALAQARLQIGQQRNNAILGYSGNVQVS